MKKRLTDLTKEALESGSFGAPWSIVTNESGKTEVFFGSDRWEHICQFLGVEYQGYFPGEQAQARL